jgi:predicted dienelactone hydrolase
MNRLTRLLAFTTACVATGVAAAATGETHRSTTTPTAALRDASGSPRLAITVWYPATGGAVEKPLLIGPPDRPLFDSGRAAPDAPVANGRHPVVLLSHGFGGTARSMGWFGTALADAGFIVVAVDHPGSNGLAPITVTGSAWWWERAEDLKAAWAAVRQDDVLGPHLDASRLGVAGFSAGGFTTLVAAGARVDVDHFVAFCKVHPDEGVCAPQLEAPELSSRHADTFLADPKVRAGLANAPADHAIPGVRAAFAMAPALVQALAPASLPRIAVPVVIVVGEADTVAPPATNASVAARAIPGAREEMLPRVTHYDFLATCQPAARKAVPQCAQADHQAAAHEAAIRQALQLFQGMTSQSAGAAQAPAGPLRTAPSRR